MSDAPNWQARQEDFFADVPPPSNSGHFQWSQEKLRELRPELFGVSGFFYSVFVLLRQQFNDRQFIKECLDGGDCRAAVVMTVSPLMVAAYSDELDAVVLLKFPVDFVPKYNLAVGTRLLTINNYAAGSGARDIYPGPKNTRQWDNMIPTIADFASDDAAQINQLKHKILPAEWQRCYAMGQQYLQLRPGIYRDGRPFFAGMPLAGAREYESNLSRAQRMRMIYVGASAGVLLMLLMCGGIGYITIANRKGLRDKWQDADFRNDHRQPPVPFANVEPGFARGAKVEAQWAGRWVPGEVIETLPGGGMVRVRLDDKHLGPPEAMLPRHMVRPRGGG